MNKEDLANVIDDISKLEPILETMSLVRSYNRFRNMVNLGLAVSLSDIPFDKAMVFSWIKEELDGRKT